MGGGAVGGEKGRRWQKAVKLRGAEGRGKERFSPGREIKIAF